MTTTATNEEEIRNALDAVARTFQPAKRLRFAPLIPYRNQIQVFRNQKASFRTIAKLLKRFSVLTTGETVRRFYHTVIDQTPAKRRRRRRKMSYKRRIPKTKTVKSPKTRDIGQPRIARIEDL